MENRVRVRRAELRVTQFEISRKAKINETKLSRIETGLIDPTADEIKALAKALDATPAELFPTLAAEQAEAR
jgi:transcriptional regulator with XRE-family HTH domain